MPTAIQRKTLATKLKRRLRRLLVRPRVDARAQRPFKLGLVGLGGAANWKMSELVACPAATLHAVCDTRREAVEAVLARHRVPHVFDDYRELVELGELDGVIISTPNALHCPIALAALLAGKHVLCEKPLAMNAAEARQMVEAARAANRRALVHFPYRLSAEAQFVRRLIGEGRLGRLYHLSVVYAHGGWYAEDGSLRDAPGVGGWRTKRALAGSGVLSDLGSHALDLARCWLAEADSASAALIHQGNRGEDGIDDTASYHVRYQSGALGTFVNSRCYTGRGQHFVAELYGSRAALRFQLGELHWYDRSTDRWIDVAVPESFGRSIIDEFVAAMGGSEFEAASFDDGYHVQQLLDAALESDARGCEVPVAIVPMGEVEEEKAHSPTRSLAHSLR